MRHLAARSSVALAAGVCVLAAAGCSPDNDNGSVQSAPAGRTTSVQTVSPPSEIIGSPPVLAVDIVQGRQDEPVDVEVDGGDEGVTVTFREITIEPGSTTGVHCHHGQLIAVVKQGALNHYADEYPGGVRIYRAGDAIIEGTGYVHEGRNQGTEDVILLVTYVTPVGMPLSETDLDRCENSTAGEGGPGANGTGSDGASTDGASAGASDGGSVADGGSRSDGGRSDEGRSAGGG